MTRTLGLGAAEVVAYRAILGIDRIDILTVVMYGYGVDDQSRGCNLCIMTIPKSQNHAIGLWSLQSGFAEVVPARFEFMA